MVHGSIISFHACIIKRSSLQSYGVKLVSVQGQFIVLKKCIRLLYLLIRSFQSWSTAHISIKCVITTLYHYKSMTNVNEASLMYLSHWHFWTPGTLMKVLYFYKVRRQLNQKLKNECKRLFIEHFASLIEFTSYERLKLKMKREIVFLTQRFCEISALNCFFFRVETIWIRSAFTTGIVRFCLSFFICNFVLLPDKFDQFWAVNRRLMEPIGDQDGFKHIPIRSYNEVRNPIIA